MFIYNLKLNSKTIYKVIIITLIVLALIITMLSCFKIFKSNKFKTNDSNNLSLTNVNENNYTNILDMVHNNLNEYIGEKFKYSGFVYRVYDFSDDQFVLGRNMIISSDFQTLVVGFLCKYDKISNFKDNTWVEIEGTVSKTDYYGEIPIIEVTHIKKVDKPSNEYVYPPNKK